MQLTRTIEIGVGLFVATGLAALLVLAMQVSNLSVFGTGGGYVVTAHFDNVGGLKVRAPVTAGGVHMGRVTAIDYDSGSYEAVVRMRIDDRYNQLPTDTSASIYTAGLLGEQYVGLEPGGAGDYLAEGGAIYLTESAMVLERIISQFLFDKAASGGKE